MRNACLLTRPGMVPRVCRGPGFACLPDGVNSLLDWYCMKVHCLKQLRQMEATGEAPEEFRDYVPKQEEVQLPLLKRICLAVIPQTQPDAVTGGLQRFLQQDCKSL